jgi:uncharacterized protein (TIGR02246 family)
MSVRDEVQSRNRLFEDAVASSDGRAVAALYTEDAWLLAPGAPAIRGRAEIEAFWSGRFEGIDGVQLTTVDAVQLGPDGAREIGRFRMALKGKADPSIGKYVVVWRRVDGVWHLETDAFNSDG